MSPGAGRDSNLAGVAGLSQGWGRVRLLPPEAVSLVQEENIPGLTLLQRYRSEQNLAHLPFTCDNVRHCLIKFTSAPNFLIPFMSCCLGLMAMFVSRYFTSQRRSFLLHDARHGSLTVSRS